MIRINWGAQRFEAPTGHSIDVKHWDDKAKHVKLLRGNQDLRDIYADITRQQADLEREWNRLHHIKKDEFTAAEFKSYLAGDLDPH